MRLFLALIPLAVVSANWFGGNSDQQNQLSYQDWSTKDLQDWLQAHQIPLPTKPADETTWRESLVDSVERNWNSASAWTQDQYLNAQKTFSSLREDTFESWDESRLREWLLEQGIVSPKSKKEELVLLAKQRYKSYSTAANEWSNWAADKTAAGTAAVTSYAATATDEVVKAMDDAKDYVYSTWDDNRLRTYLEEKGVIKTKQEKKRDELLKMMYDAYYKTTNPVYEAWSTSYIHQWLVDHNLATSTQTPTEKARQNLLNKMNEYYYSVNTKVWDSWDESQLRSWLVENNIVQEKEAKGLTREKLVKTVSDSYNNAASTVSSTWTDSQLREWLVANDYLKTTDAEKVKRGDLVKLFKEKFPKSKDPLSYTPHPYVSWSTPRLRAFLVESGVKERDLPKTREELLWRVSYKWDSAKNTWRTTERRSAEESTALFKRVQDLVNGGVEKAEDTLAKVWEVMTGHYQSGVEQADETEKKVIKEAKRKEEEARKKAEKVKSEL